MLLLEYNPVFECSHCSQILLYENDIAYSDYVLNLCKPCLHKHYFICHDCEDCYNTDYTYYTIIEDYYYYCEDCYNEKYAQCSNCDEHTLQEEAFYNEDSFYCEDCYSENFVICTNCEDTLHTDDSLYHNDEYYCNSCYHEKLGQCEDCGTVESWDYLYYNEHTDYYYCENCYNEHNIQEFNSKPLNLENNTFNHIKYTRKYGIELEIASENIPYCDIENNTVFGSKEDCSLNCGAEIESPILQGDKGYNEIKKLCDIVKDCDNDNSSGYHLHIDYRDICQDYNIIKKTWILYHRVEKILYSILPEDRQNNRYCYQQKLPIYYILGCKDMEELRNLFYSADNEHGSRYFGINIHSIFSNRTLEIRCHSGTVNFQKIIQWIKINLSIVDYAINNDIDTINELTRNIKGLYDYINILEKIGCNTETIEYYKERYLHFNKFSCCNVLG